ncbi:hypothetical protein [Arthrobacter bambusae]|uniref:hypothetical protein n=1 Tax=Arthrobacter bambusae TaxID=1338426 RepID=UPI00277E026C|nr:hypothetical protein [Arthrobacter bambusae]MDQ0029034.1 hypothetical protein [Arthrobacter bambusae]MDQ0098564.1 hypothetical protein [Arthrobacter bambusae]
MSTISSTYFPRDAQQPRGKQPWCATCDTDLHLVVDSIAIMDRISDTLAVAFSCAGCGGSRVLSTTAGFVAAVLARSSNNNDVLHLGAEYIHCGEPMTLSDPDLRNSLIPLSTQPRPADFLGAYLRSRVLRCRCGFQMEKPH